MSHQKRKTFEGLNSNGLATFDGIKRASGIALNKSKYEKKKGEEYEDPFGDDEEQVEDEDMVMTNDDKMVDTCEDGEESSTRLFLQEKDKVGTDEMLEYDNSAYLMLHQLKLEWPSLSFDFIRDLYGMKRTRFPISGFLALGSQTPTSMSSHNKLLIMKMKDLYKTKRDRDEFELSDTDESSDDEANLDDDPVIDHRSIKHMGSINRIRSMPQHPNILATWSDAARVYIWDVQPQLDNMGYQIAGGRKLDHANNMVKSVSPLFAFRGHKVEGFAMDWSPVETGRLATGDCQNNIFLYHLESNGQCRVDNHPLRDHSASVEDIQWSHTEATVFASCSVDKTIKIWDTRNRNKGMLNIEAHNTDVNVISWNRRVAYLLASGADDGSFKVWDLRMLKPNEMTQPVGNFTWHKAPITSIEWNPHDESVIAVSGDDNQVSVWDLALEEDYEHASTHPKLRSEAIGSDGHKVNLPPQLLFLHQGQSQPKEIHFHTQIPGLIGSTAADGMHMFICEPLDPKPSKLLGNS